jgi:periplasmic protein TonB
VASSPAFQEPRQSPVLKIALLLGGLLLLIGLAWFIYVQMTGTLTTKVKDDQPVQMSPDLLPPPPPPPPPPPDVKPPEPTDAPKPTPEPAAAPKPDAPAPMQMNAPAEAGTSGIASGAGGGSGSPGTAGGTCKIPPCGGGGGGFSDALYRGNLARDLQDRILDNDKVNRLSFKATFAISVGAGGQVTRAELLASSGDAKRDQILLSILQATRGLEPPPSQVKFPQRVVVTGRRSF